MNIEFSPLSYVIPQDQLEEILSQDCDIDLSFLGFTEVYQSLSEIIPVHFKVLDFGCGFAAQSYYFRNHKQYVGIDLMQKKRFSFSNTIHCVKTIQDFIKEDLMYFDVDETFAICSYVPDEEAKEMIKNNLKNLFVFYPSNKEGWNIFLKDAKNV